MSYRIREKWADYDEGYINRWGEKCSRFDAETFGSKEEAERAKHSRVWRLDGFSEEFEITNQ